MRISVLAIDGVFDTGLSAMLDAFATANELGEMLMAGAPRFEVTVVGVRKKVRTSLGFQVPVHPISGDVPDWVVIAALATKTPETLVPSLARPDMLDAKVQLRVWHEAGASIAASCIGAFLLAETGLLDEREATCTWWLGPLFRQRYPAVRLDEERMLVSSDRLATAAAALGHLDLALWLIRKASPELAAIVARYLLADLRSSQGQYIIPNHLAQADPLIEAFEKWSRGHLDLRFSLQTVAEALATTPRTLQRRSEAALGKSPLAYFQDLRVERAQQLARTSDLDVDAIAAKVGYVDGATLRALLRRRLGRGVRELRAEMQ
jgi:transcriptional regulator GlxA family with amidase domain